MKRWVGLGVIADNILNICRAIERLRRRRCPFTINLLGNRACLGRFQMLKIKWT
jgi:hypothetical protein